MPEKFENIDETDQFLKDSNYKLMQEEIDHLISTLPS